MPFSPVEKVNKILTEVTQWVFQRRDISAFALVGSWARSNARIDSDIDLMFLTPNASTFRSNKRWIDEIDWKSVDSEVKEWKDADYGAVWSRHLYLGDETEIEFSFALPSWASVEPLDAGTFGVVSNGCRILYDPEGLLNKLLKRVETKY
jgi:predicted nucleotidyltransferase